MQTRRRPRSAAAQEFEKEASFASIVGLFSSHNRSLLCVCRLNGDRVAQQRRSSKRRLSDN